MASQPPLVTQADIDAYIASYQKAQADKIAQLKAAEATGMSDQYTQLYGGADIIPGLTQNILSNLGIENPYLPVYSLIGSASVGNNLANERMQFAPTPGVSYRLVDKNTGQITTANTPEEIKALIAQSNALSASGGKKADLAIESNQTGSWSPVFRDEPNVVMDTFMKLIAAGMLAATGAGLLQPGGLGGLGAAGTTGAGATGAGLGTTGSLAGGALSSLPANLAAIQAGANAALAGAGLGTAAGVGAGTAALAGGGIDALPGITVTAATGGSAVPVVAPLAVAGTTAAATSGSSAANAASDAAISQNTQNAVDTAYQNAQTGAASDLAAAGYNGMGAGAFVAPGAAATVGGGVLGTGLTLAQLASITGIGVDLLGKLIGGGGDGGATTPYTSPFGAGPTFAPAARTQVNPNITDYEKYGFGPEALFFSGGQRLDTYRPPAATTPAATTPAATTPEATTPAATTPAATTTNLIDSAASGGSTNVGTNGPVQLTLTEGASGGSPVILEGGNKGPATPANTGMTQERLDQLQERYDNMRSGEFFNYFKAVNDVLGNYVAKGVITPDIAKQYQSRLETAASTPNATLASLQAAVPMPQISQFIKPTGTRPVYTYTAPSQPITDRSAYINDLYKQLGAQFSQGLLAAPQVQNIQGQLRQAYLNPQSTIEQFQNIFNTGMQQYKPLI